MNPTSPSPARVAGVDRHRASFRARRGRAWRSMPLLALTGAALGAQAQSHQVFVNVQRMSDAQVARLARAQCHAIPDGRYCLHWRSGAWGCDGNPRVQGVVGALCRVARRRPGLSERGLLYRPGEIIDGR